MAKLDNIRRVVKEDYDTKYHDLIGKLAYVLNSFMEQVNTEMNGNLDFENLKQDLVTFRIEVDASGVPKGTGLLRTKINNPRGFQVIKSVDVDDTDLFVTNQPAIKFTSGTSSQVIKIKKITGLTANRKYDLTVVVFG